MIERLNREIRRRTRVVGGFPDGNSALMLVCARIRYVTANEWSTRRYLDMSRLDDNLHGSELIIAPWTAMIQSAQLFGHYLHMQIFTKLSNRFKYSKSRKLQASAQTRLTAKTIYAVPANRTRRTTAQTYLQNKTSNYCDKCQQNIIDGKKPDIIIQKRCIVAPIPNHISHVS